MKDETKGTSSFNDLNTLNFFDSGFEQTDEVLTVPPGYDIRGRSPNISTIGNSSPGSLVSQHRAATSPSLSSNELLTRKHDDANIIDNSINFINEDGDHSSEGSFENTSSPFVPENQTVFLNCQRNLMIML